MALDPQFSDLLTQAANHPLAKEGAQQAPAADPSAGGGTLQVWNPFGKNISLGIHTPQPIDRLLSGAGQGLTDVARHVGNMLGGVGGTTNANLAQAKALDAPLLNTTAGKVGQFIGQTAATAPIGMGAAAGLARMGSLGARLAASPFASGVLQGAGQGALLADPGQKLAGAGVGALAGGVLPLAGGVVSKVASGLSRTPAAQTLIDAGVYPSVGQLNPKGFANRMEQAAEGTFGLGDLMQNAREAPMRQYARTMVQRSMAPGSTLPESAQDFGQMIGSAADSFDAAYQAPKGFPVSPKIMREGTDMPLATAFENVAAKPRIGLNAGARADLGQQLQDQLNETIAQAKRDGGMQSDHLLALRSSIRDAIRGESGTDNASRAAKGLWKDAENQVTQALDSQLPPNASQALRATDAQYRKFVTVRDAAASAKDRESPTPYQFSTAIAKNTPKTAYAAGAGENRDLSKAAAETFQNNVPRTGLAGVGRLALPATLGYLGAPAIMAHPLVAGAAAAPLLGAAGLTLTPIGRRLAAGATPLQRSLAAGIGRLTSAIPPKVANLPQLYGQTGLLGLMAPRLQQMPSQ